jgi:hypothetical protein
MEKNNKKEDDIRQARQGCHPANVFGPFLLISLGVLLLLNNFGIVSWEVWSLLWKFWPVILIVWGIEAIFGKGWIGRLLVSVVSLLLLAFALSYSISCLNPNFDKWITKNFSYWERLKTFVPKENKTLKRKVFRCDPFSGECSVYYK